MKLTDLTYIPPNTPSPQPTVPGNSVPLTSGNGQQTADSSKIVYGSNAGNGGGIEYPTASNEKIGASELSGATKAGGGRRGEGQVDMEVPEVDRIQVRIQVRILCQMGKEVRILRQMDQGAPILGQINKEAPILCQTPKPRHLVLRIL